MFKVLTRTSNKGFTIIELLVGLIITVIIGGLAMDALITSGSMFASDKRDIDNGQNLSAILEIVGNDIRQAGEQIPDANFPVIEIRQEGINSSTITIRRALTIPLTLCEDIPKDINPTAITIADTAVGTSICNPFPVISGVAPTLAPAISDAQNYRCKLGAPDANYIGAPNPSYDVLNTTNFCNISSVSPGYNAALQKVRGVVSDLNGHFRTFTYVGEVITAPPKYQMTLSKAMPSDIINNVSYKAAKPDEKQPAAIYLIEERTYTLDPNGNLTVTVDGDKDKTSVLIKGITRFKIAAKEYTNITDKAINPNPLNKCVAADYDQGEIPPTTPTAADPAYSCIFNRNTTDGTSIRPTPDYTATVYPTADYTARSWKKIAGIKVGLQAKYDPTGRDANPTGDLKKKIDEKLSVTAEFFPRNVLSK